MGELSDPPRTSLTACENDPSGYDWRGGEVSIIANGQRAGDGQITMTASQTVTVQSLTADVSLSSGESLAIVGDTVQAVGAAHVSVSSTEGSVAISAVDKVSFIGAAGTCTLNGDFVPAYSQAACEEISGQANWVAATGTCIDSSGSKVEATSQAACETDTTNTWTDAGMVSMFGTEGIALETTGSIQMNANGTVDLISSRGATLQSTEGEVNVLAKTALTLNSTHGTTTIFGSAGVELQSTTGSIVFTAAESASVQASGNIDMRSVEGDILVRADQNLKIVAGSGTCRDSSLAVVAALTQTECEDVVGQVWTPATGKCTAANLDIVEASSRAICEDGTTHTWTPAGTLELSGHSGVRIESQEGDVQFDATGEVTMDSGSSLSINAPYNDISMAAGRDMNLTSVEASVAVSGYSGASVMAHTGDVSIVAANEDASTTSGKAIVRGNLGVELSAVGICAETATTGSCRRVVLEACVDPDGLVDCSGFTAGDAASCTDIGSCMYTAPSSLVVDTFTESACEAVAGQEWTAPSMQSQPLDVKACAAVSVDIDADTSRARCEAVLTTSPLDDDDTKACTYLPSHSGDLILQAGSNATILAGTAIDVAAPIIDMVSSSTMALSAGGDLQLQSVSGAVDVSAVSVNVVATNGEVELTAAGAATLRGDAGVTIKATGGTCTDDDGSLLSAETEAACSGTWTASSGTCADSAGVPVLQPKQNAKRHLETATCGLDLER